MFVPLISLRDLFPMLRTFPKDPESCTHDWAPPQDAWVKPSALTTPVNRSPAHPAMICSAISCATLVWASSVLAPR